MKRSTKVTNRQSKRKRVRTFKQWTNKWEMWSKRYKNLPKQRDEQKKKHTHEKWFIDWWCAPTDKARTQRIRLPIKCIFSGAPTKKPNRWYRLSFFSLRYVPFSIARPISHNWKVEMVFVCPCTGYNQSYWNSTHRTASDQMLTSPKKNTEDGEKIRSTWKPAEKIKNQRAAKSKHKVERTCWECAGKRRG